MKKLLIIFILFPFIVEGQNYVIKYVDTTAQTYVINDTLKGELIKIRHLYTYDTILLKKEIKKYNNTITEKQDDLQYLIARKGKEIDKLKVTRKRLIRILQRLRQ